MRRTAIMLLQHGPLSVSEFHEIMGARTYRQCQRLLSEMHRDGFLRQPRRGVYALATS